MQDSECIFCKIGAHEIPTNVVYEDEDVIAFDDMEPLMPVHTLVIPKEVPSSNDTQAKKMSASEQ